MGALIDGAYDGTVTPFAIGGLVVTAAAYLLYRWSDAMMAGVTVPTSRVIEAVTRG